MRNGLLAAIAIFMFCVSGANAAGYTCDTKVYVECKSGYYLSGYGSSASSLTCSNGTEGGITESASCLACPTGCTCSGGTKCPLCGYKITLDMQSGSGGTTMIYQHNNGNYYKEDTYTNQITSSVNAITPPRRAGYVFGGYYTKESGAGTLVITSTGNLASNPPNFTAAATVYAKWSACTAGYYCPAGSTSVTQNECSAGTYSQAGWSSCQNVSAGCMGAAKATTSCPTACGGGKWSAAGSASCKEIKAGCYGTSGTQECPNECSAGTYSQAGWASCQNVDAGCMGAAKATTSCPTACGDGKWSAAGSASCSQIKAGCYGTSGTQECPNQCEAGTYSTAGASKCTDCPGGTYGSTKGLTSEACSGNCTAGYYCPAGSTSATQNSCTVGNYCPEKSASQAACGGDLTSNANAKAKTECYLTCSAGKYLAKSSNSCATCLADHYCTGTGGNLKYSTTADQGITKCPHGSSAAGSKKESDCKVVVTLNKNGGSGTCGGQSGTTAGSVTCSYNVECALPTWNASTCNFTNGNEIFQNWGTSSLAMSGGVTKITATDSTTLYAIWNDTVCSVENGTSAVQTPTNNTPKCNVTCNDGYQVSGPKTGEAGKTTVSYTCSVVNYNIKYANGGGTGNAPASPTKCTYGDGKKAPANTYKKTGYHFNGWKCTGGTSACDGDDIIAAEADISKLSVTDGSTITLTATWAANTYTVKYSCGEGATGTPPNGISAEYDKSYVVASNKSCSKKGFKFLDSWKYNNTNYVSGEKTIKNLTAENGATVTLTANYEPSKVGCSAGKMFDYANVECISCKSGYYCAEWCMKDGQPNCDYNQSGIYANIGDNKYSKNFTGCPLKTTSDVGAKTITMCYFDGKNNFKDNIGSFKIENIKSYVYVKQ
ncbi:MAG: InlB B-repeat-containing protein [Alphaproteobacteria bacterium]|nr:InlB B-repeat-containing protein [Alphaproteobacteria bacterium]